ncbi:riboflavin biosynthesis protein RibD [Streptomyces sp. NPDC051172]|uniref:dihydrofolate reductase family protein n=1 Tax=Streptomyces sp. NPDC051172 TaxID=3155796 RepID=UPI003442780D
MGEVIARLAMSLDGYIAGPESGREHPLGIGGERLHSWVFGLRSFRQMQGMQGGDTGPDADLIAEHVARPGAVVMGHGMYITGEIPWGEEPPFHAPVYVVTHHAREALVKKGGTTFHFVTEGPGRALELAREAAGAKDVSLAGGPPGPLRAGGGADRCSSSSGRDGWTSSSCTSCRFSPAGAAGSSTTWATSTSSGRRPRSWTRRG